MKAFVNDATGAIERIVSLDAAPFEPERPGTSLRDWPEGLDPAGLIWPAGEPAPRIDAAGALTRAKAAAFDRVRALREVRKDGGLLTPLGPIQTDPDSRTNINGAVQMATILGAAFAIEWRMADDSRVPLDAAAMIQLGLLVGQHIGACQARKNVLDDEIDAATSEAALEAIDFTAGWPGL